MALRLSLHALVSRKEMRSQYNAREWRKLLEKLGGLYIKVGQFLSVRTDVFSWELCEELSKLLDSAGPFPAEQAIAMIESELGEPIEEIFGYFESEPIAAASIAQVHVGRLRASDVRVAVKVLRPGIHEKMAVDLQILLWMARLSDTLNATRSRTEFFPVMREFQRTLQEEVSLLSEARACDEFRKLVKGHKYIRAPKVYFEYSTDSVLTMKYIEGVPLSVLIKAIEGNDQPMLERLREMGVDRRVVASRLYRSFLHQALELNIAHGDPHPGNILILPKNRLCYLDFGAVAYYGPSFRMKQERIFRAAALEDVEELVRALVASWEPLPPRDIERFKSEIKPIYLRTLVNSRSKRGDPRWKSSGQAFMEVSKLAARWDIYPPAEGLRYNRMLLELDAIVITLDAGFNNVKAMRRYFANREKRRLRAMVSAQNLQRVATEALRVATELPADIHELRYQMYATFNRSRHLYSSVLSKTSSLVGIFMNQALLIVRTGAVALIVARLAMGAEPLEDFLAQHARLSLHWWVWLLGTLYLSSIFGRVRYISSELHQS